MGIPSSPTRFERPPKAAFLVARQIVEDIETLGLVPGDGIGAERELMDRHEVSRATLREAIRILEVHGVVRTRAGVTNGPTILAPDARAVIGSLSLLLQRSASNLSDLVEARTAMAAIVYPNAIPRFGEHDWTVLAERIDAAAAAADPVTYAVRRSEFVEHVAARAENGISSHLFLAIDIIGRTSLRGLDFEIRDLTLSIHRDLIARRPTDAAEVAETIRGAGHVLLDRLTQTRPETMARLVTWQLAG